MEIEQGMLRSQSSQISCLTDDLIRITRKLSSVTCTASGSMSNPALAFAFNTLLSHRLERSVAMFSIILEMVLASIPAEPETVPDNIVTLQQQPHSSPSVDMRPTS